MRLRSIVALGALLIGAAACANLDQSSPVAPKASKIDKTQYAVINASPTLTWQQASDGAATLTLKKQTGWTLVSIHSAAENAAVLKLLRSHTCWIGATYSTTSTAWTWSDGTAWDYSNFWPGQGSPNEDRNAAIGFTDGTWLSYNSTMQLPCYVVKHS